MSHSVRLRLVCWLKGIINKSRQNVSEVLGHEQAHPDAAHHVSLCEACSINGNRAEREAHHLVQVPMLCNDVYEIRLASVIPQGNNVVAQPQMLAAYQRSLDLQSFLLSHQPSPLGKNYLPNLTAKPSGVEA